MYNFQQCVIFIIIIILFLHPPWVWGCCFCFPLTPLEGKEGQALAVPPAAAPRNRSGPMQCVWPVPAEKKKNPYFGEKPAGNGTGGPAKVAGTLQPSVAVGWLAWGGGAKGEGRSFGGFWCFAGSRGETGRATVPPAKR